MPRKGQDRTRLTGRLTLLFRHNAVLPSQRPPPQGLLPRIYAPIAFVKPFFGLSTQMFPCYPILSHENPNALGGASGVHAGWSGEPAGSGGPVGR